MAHPGDDGYGNYESIRGHNAGDTLRKAYDEGKCIMVYILREILLT